MDNDGMPFVAVIGGLWQLDPAQATVAKETGKIVGAELAKAGFGLVVYFSDENSLEPYVVSGYAAAVPEGVEGVIRVRYAESQRGQVKFDEQETHPELFDTPHLFPGPDWEAPFYRSLTAEDSVDAVVLLGGANSTFIAGQIAMARRLPILAIDEFGGSAGKIWNQLAQASPDKKIYSWGTRPASAFVTQLKSMCNEAAAMRQEVRRREQAFTTIIAHWRRTVYAAGAFVVLLATLFFGMVYTPRPGTYPFVMFAALISAGATGALIRAVLGGPREDDPRASLLLGSVAGFVVGLAYLIPQWVGAPGVLEPKAEMVSATDKIQFVSAVLVAVSAGIGFDTVFNRLQKEAQDAAISPPR